MKTSNKLIMCIYCLSVLLTSCSESTPYVIEAYQNSNISSYPSSITIDDELSGSFTIHCSDKWYVYDLPWWINIDNYYGEGNTTIHFTVDENTADDNRYGNITIYSDDGFEKTTSVYVTQKPTIKFEATMNTTNYKAEGDYWWLNITASTNAKWTISRPYSDSWVHFGDSSNSSSSYNGSGTEQVTIYVDSNPYTFSRSCDLTITCGTMSQKITITQEASPSVSATWSYFSDLSYSSGSWAWINITAGSNTEWTLSSNCSWIWFNSVSSKNGNQESSWTKKGTQKVYVISDKNTRGYSRSATIYLKVGSTTINSWSVTQNY